jgi:hypothetical protein
MKTYRDLYIHLNGVDIETFSKLLEDQCKEPWIRQKDKEIELGVTGDKPLCFEAKSGTPIAAAALFIFPKRGETWWVSNIVPTEVTEISYDQYNAALEDFYERIVRPAINGTAIEAELTSGEISVGSVAGEAVESALARFSNLANKSTGSSHPLDKKRWFEFLVLANEAKSDLHADLVIRALTELGWSTERAFELGLEFEFAEDLLSYLKER